MCMDIYVCKCVCARVYTGVYACTHMVNCFLNVPVCNCVNGSTHLKGHRVKKTRGWQMALLALTGASVHTVQEASHLPSAPGTRGPRPGPERAEAGKSECSPPRRHVALAGDSSRDVETSPVLSQEVLTVEWKPALASLVRSWGWRRERPSSSAHGCQSSVFSFTRGVADPASRTQRRGSR